MLQEGLYLPVLHRHDMLQSLVNESVEMPLEAIVKPNDVITVWIGCEGAGDWGLILRGD